jgi:hypothetical protein
MSDRCSVREVALRLAIENMAGPGYPCGWDLVLQRAEAFLKFLTGGDAPSRLPLPIEFDLGHLELGPRVLTALRGAGIKDIDTLRRENLRFVPGLGPVGRAEIERALAVWDAGDAGWSLQSSQAFDGRAS